MSVVVQLSIMKVTYWQGFLLNIYEEIHNASYRGTADLRLHTYKTVWGLHLHLAVNEKS